MKPHKYTVGIVTEPYFYYYHSVPYFESMYIAQHDTIYDPETESDNILILNDGTRVEPLRLEGFGFSKKSNLLIILFIILIIIFIYLFKKI